MILKRFIYCIGLYEFHKVCHRQDIPQCLQKGIKTYEKMALMYLRFQLMAEKTSCTVPYETLPVVGRCSQSWVGYPSEDKDFSFEC